MLTGYVHTDDGTRWVRIMDSATGREWDDPVSDYVRVLNLIDGSLVLRNKLTGLELVEV